MSNRTFNSSDITKRLRDLNVSQQMYCSLINGRNPTNPQTGNYDASIVGTELIPGAQTTVEQSLRGAYSFNLGGIANCLTPNIPTGTSQPLAAGIAQWAVDVRNEAVDIIGLTIATDSLNNVYVSGRYNTTSTFIVVQDVSGNTQTPSSITLPPTLFNDIFLIKYNSSGIAQWAINLQGTASDLGDYIAIDAGNNIYLAGTYNSTTQVIIQNASGNGQAPSSITLPATTSADAFIVKYNTSGQAQWATYLKGDLFDETFSITFDSLNDIYITGVYTSTIPVILQNVSGNTQTPSAITLPDTSGNDIFIVKYSPIGQAQWAVNFKGSGSDVGYGITSDTLDNIYITGYYFSTSQVFLQNAFGNGQVPSSITLPATTTTDIFIIKYNSTGQAQWATYFKGSSVDIGYGITSDISNNIYITGEYRSTTPVILQDASGNTQTPSTISLPSTQAQDVFVIKYNSAGIVQWGTYLQAGFSDSCYSITIDTLSNIYITGFYQSTLNIYDVSGSTQALSSITLQPSVNNDIFIIKYSSGGIAQWATKLQSTGVDVGYAITTDTANNIYVTGYYNSSTPAILLDASGNTQKPSTISLPSSIFGSRDLFVIKYNSTGQAQWGTNLSNSGSNNGYSVTYDSQNNIYITGSYISPRALTVQNVFGNSQVASSITLPASTNQSMYLIKYNPNGIAQWAINLSGTSDIIGWSVKSDYQNNIYVVGQYLSSTIQPILQNASGNGQTPSTIKLPITLSIDVFLIKYNSDGQAQWATYFGSGSTDIGYSLAIDSFNNIYITGQYIGQVTLQDASGNGQVPSPIILQLISGFDAFIVKYNSSGIAQWATNLGSTGTDIGYSITTDKYNNLYITGQYSENILTLFDASGTGQTPSLITLPLITGTLTNAFLVKYNSLGIAQWATYLAATQTDIGYSVITDTLNNIYITGQYQTNVATQVVIQDASGISQAPSAIRLPGSTTLADVFIIKYNSAGQAQWATYLKGISQDIGYSIASDAANNIYITGQYFASTPIFVQNASGNWQTPSAITLPTSTSTDAFIIKYNSDGQAQWATCLRGTSGDVGRSIMVDPLYNIYLLGTYTSSQTIIIQNASGNSQVASSITLPSTASQNSAFLIKYN